MCGPRVEPGGLSSWTRATTRTTIPNESTAGSEQPVAVIDIGSNSGRVVVYRFQAGAHLQILASSRASLRLVREVDESRRLSPEATARAWEALRDFRAIAQGAGARRIAAVATAAVRDAANGPEFIARARAELEIDVRILSGDEEARYGFLGAVRGLPVEHGVLFDLGGGSMQVSRFRQRRLMTSASLPLGALRLSDAFLRYYPPTGGEIRRLKEHVREQLEQSGVVALEEGEELIGTGGTVRNVAKIDRSSRGSYPISRLHGYVVPRRRVKEIAGKLASRRLKKRTQVAGLNDDRGDSIVGGGLAVQTLMELLRADAVQVSGQGVREGLALSLVSEGLPLVAAVRQASIQALASRFDGWVEEPARRRTELADALLGALAVRPDREVREALGHAATILDIGRSIDFFDRHQHVAAIVLATDLNGFSHREVALLSAIVRSAGDEDTSPKSYAPLLGAEDRPAVTRAGVILALADDIEERCPRGVPVHLHCKVEKNEVRVDVPVLAGWRPRTIGRRFERTFGRPLVVTTGG